VFLAAALSALAGTALLSQAHDLVAVLVAVVLFASGFSGMVPIADARAVEAAGQERSGYGPLRAWGSISYVVVAFGTGASIDRFGIGAPFVVLAVTLTVTALVGSSLRPPSRLQAVRSPDLGTSATLRALATPTLGLFLVGAWLMFTTLGAVTAFITLRFAELGAPAAMIGASTAVGAAVEVPIMLRFPWLAARFGSDRLVVLGAVVFAVRAFLTSLTAEPAILVALSGLGGIGYACFMVGGVTWVSRHAPRDLAATAQSLFSGVTNALGQVTAGAMGGWIGLGLGLTGLFAASAALGVAAVIVLGLAIRAPAIVPGREPAG
jgi:PPP family 3-phenylpropionic acid transporter